MTMLEITSLSFSYGNEPILNELNLSVQKGEIVSIIGPSGSGKTTLLGLLAGILEPQAGEVEVLGKAFSTLHGVHRDLRDRGVLRLQLRLLQKSVRHREQADRGRQEREVRVQGISDLKRILGTGGARGAGVRPDRGEDDQRADLEGQGAAQASPA